MDTSEMLMSIDDEIERLTKVRELLVGTVKSDFVGVEKKVAIPNKHKMSPEAKAKIGEAVRARWKARRAEPTKKRAPKDQ